MVHVGRGALAIALQARGVEDVVVIDPRPIAETLSPNKVGMS